MMKKQQSGNVLFLILIAVALFAALSYAVTKSTSGGGNATKEKLNLEVSEFLQQAAYYKIEFMRRELNGQSLVTGVNPGEMFAAGTGANYHTIPKSVTSPLVPITYSWIFQKISLQLDTVDLGTSEQDYVIGAYISEEACKNINQQFHQTTTPPAMTGEDNNATQGTIAVMQTSHTIAPTMQNEETHALSTLAPPACYTPGPGAYVYIDIALQK